MSVNFTKEGVAKSADERCVPRKMEIHVQTVFVIVTVASRTENVPTAIANMDFVGTVRLTIAGMRSL